MQRNEQFKRNVTDFSFKFVCFALAHLAYAALFAHHSNTIFAPSTSNPKCKFSSLVFCLTFGPRTWIPTGDRIENHSFRFGNSKVRQNIFDIRSNFLLRFVPGHCAARKALLCNFACWVETKKKTQSEQMAESQSNQKYTRKHIKL